MTTMFLKLFINILIVSDIIIMILLDYKEKIFCEPLNFVSIAIALLFGF